MPKVSVEKYIGIDSSEITERKHNIWIGISMSNKAFTPENIEALIRFALEHTKEKVLIWIPGRMQATNYYYFDKTSRANALKICFEEEDRFKNVIGNIIQTKFQNQREKISISNYDEASVSRTVLQREVFFREFAKQGTFYDAVIGVTEEIIVARGRTVKKERVESLALYVLQELPVMVDGIQTLHDDTIYTVLLYPGSGKMDQLEMDIVEGKKFPALTKALQLTHKVGILDISLI